MRRFAAFVTMAWVLAACGVEVSDEQADGTARPGSIELPPPGDTAVEADFLQGIEQRAGDFPAVPDQDMVELGRSVCKGFADGDTTEQVLAELRGTRYGFDAAQARAIVEAAVEELCPDAE